MVETEKFSSQIEKTKNLISNARSIVITCHERPDGDALGSCLALKNYLNKKGIQSIVIPPTVYPNFLKWMPGEDDVITFDRAREKATEIIQKSDLIFCLDFNSLKRVGEPMLQALTASDADYIMIDHHLEPDDFAKAMFSRTSASSTAELVFELIEALGDIDMIDYDIAVNLYTGILTDTGMFQFSNTTARVHYIVSKLLSTGIDPSFVYNEIYNSFSLNRLRFFGYCLTKKLKVIPEHNAAYIAISSEEMKRFAIGVGDTEGLVNYPLKMKNVEVAALFKEQNEKIKISFRSKGDNNVNLLARTHFDGGGHKNASGGLSLESLEITTQKFEEVLNNFSYK